MKKLRLGVAFAALLGTSDHLGAQSGPPCPQGGPFRKEVKCWCIPDRELPYVSGLYTEWNCADLRRQFASIRIQVRGPLEKTDEERAKECRESSGTRKESCVTRQELEKITLNARAEKGALILNQKHQEEAREQEVKRQRELRAAGGSESATSIPHYNVDEACSPMVSPGRINKCIENEQSSYNFVNMVWDGLSRSDKEKCIGIADGAPPVNKYFQLRHCVEQVLARKEIDRKSRDVKPFNY
jgi:hypothetical protein